MSNKINPTNCTAIATINNGGFLKRIINEIEQPLKSAVESTSQLTTSLIVASAYSVDLSVTTLNVVVEGLGYSAKYSADTLKQLDIESSIKSISADLLKDR